MINRKSKQNFFAQRGYAMLGIIAAIGVATTAVVVTSLSATAVRNDQARKDSSAMAIAKQALIAFAASHPTRPGILPCPDIADVAGVFDGQSDLTESGACRTFVGRLPTQTLGLPDLRDGAGERLWYVLSTNFADATANTGRINSNSYGTLIARDGEQMTYGVVAIIIAPGKTVGSQRRATPNVNNWENYLESYTISTSTALKLPADSTHNDLLSVITPADIFSVVERRVTKEVQVALDNYYKAPTTVVPPHTYHSQPYPAQTAIVSAGTYIFPATEVAASPVATVLSGYVPSDDAALVLPAWFGANLWNAVVTYRVDSNCVPSNVLAATGTCGTAFVGFSAPANSALVGGTAAAVGNGTMAVVSFNGVNAMYSNFKSTVLHAAVQTP